MLVSGSRLIGTPILSMQAAGQIAKLESSVIDPDSLKVLAFRVESPLVRKAKKTILDTRSIREYSKYGIVVDSIDDLSEEEDVVKIGELLELNFDLNGLKVETKKGSKLGRVIDWTVTTDNFMVQQLIVRRPVLKALIDPELTIPRSEIVKITDYKIIVKDEEKKIREKAETEDFIPNFVNPFRKSEQAPVRAQTENPVDKDIE